MQRDVLDHGYIKFIEAWGSDERIIEAARQSTQAGFKGWGDWKECRTCFGEGKYSRLEISPDCETSTWITSRCEACQGNGGSGTRGDERLLRYLWEHEHSTPFEFAGAVFEVQAPIFVVREWHRHRTQSYSEASARYGPLPALDYYPTFERITQQTNEANKQASAIKGAPPMTMETALVFGDMLKRTYETIEETYQQALAMGVPKELARVVLPVGRYTRMRASANLRNWLGFIRLRNAPDAQWEIQQYAAAVEDFLAERFPRTLALFREARDE